MPTSLNDYTFLGLPTNIFDILESLFPIRIKHKSFIKIDYKKYTIDGDPLALRPIKRTLKTCWRLLNPACRGMENSFGSPVPSVRLEFQVEDI